MTTPHDRYDLLCRATRRRRDDSPLSAGLAALENLLRHDLRALARQGSPDNFADILFALEQELQRFRDFCEFPDLAQKTIVGFGGAFSAGKSSLINALVGKRAVQVAADPTTALPTYLLRGTEASVVALNMFRQRVVLSEAEFASLTHEEAENHGSNVGELLQSAFVTDPDFAWDSLAFLDTPGYSKPDSESWGERTDEAIARAQLNTAHVLVWVVSAKAGTLPEEDLAFLASLRADLPRIVVVTHADAHPAAETAKVVAMMAQTLAERALPALAVIPVRANRPKSDYPLTPLLAQLDDWNQQTRALSFARHFKQQFTAYARFLEGEQRRAHLHLNRLNRILALADTPEVQADATELRYTAQAALTRLDDTSAQLHTLRQTFFAQLKAIGARVGIALPEPSELDLLDLAPVDVLGLLREARAARGTAEPDYQRQWAALTVKGDCQNTARLLRRPLDAARVSGLLAQPDPAANIPRLLRRPLDARRIATLLP